MLCPDHCRAFSRQVTQKSPSGPLSNIQKLYGLISCAINQTSSIFVCGFSYIDLELFLSICFMAIHLHHKHKLSFQTFAPFRVIISPQPFITDRLQKATYHHSSARLTPNRSLVPARLASNLPGSIQGDEPKSTYTTGVGAVTCCWMVTSNQVLDLHQFQLCREGNIHLQLCWQLNQCKQI